MSGTSTNKAAGTAGIHKDSPCSSAYPIATKGAEETEAEPTF